MTETQHSRLLEELTLASRVLWVGAHPDDEVFVFPLLAKLSMEHSVKCRLVVLKDGRHGPCQIGCKDEQGNDLAGEDRAIRLAQLRKAEEVNVAAYIDATLAYKEIPQKHTKDWTLDTPKGKEIKNMIKDEIVDWNADFVLTLDDRHGNTGHDDHIWVSTLTQAAAVEAGIPAQNILLAQARFWPDKGPQGNQEFGWKGFKTAVPEDKEVEPIVVKNEWGHLIAAVKIYKSQFIKKRLDELDNTIDEIKIIPLLRKSNVIPGDGRYNQINKPLTDELDESDSA